MPATALRCRVCETQYPLDPIGVCSTCFGPLDPVYDRDEQRRTVTRESIEAGPQSLSEYIQARFDEFSRSQKDVAQYIVDHLDEAAFQTAEELARRASTSSSTVVRFSHALGF